jgi:hypothetical protein
MNYQDPVKVAAEKNQMFERLAGEDMDEMEKRIIHVLTLYPILMPTMLHTGIGPHVKPVEWRPVLEKLVREGKIIREVRTTVSPIGQNRAYTVIRLPNADELVKIQQRPQYG